MTFDEQLQVDRAQRDSSALDIAVDGLRELEELCSVPYAAEAPSLDRVRHDVSALLDKIGAAR